MSGRVYSLTHTAAANTHTHMHRRRNGRSRMHREILGNKRALFLLVTETKLEQFRIELKKKLINTAALHRIVDTHAITRSLITHTLYG